MTDIFDKAQSHTGPQSRLFRSPEEWTGIDALRAPAHQLSRAWRSLGLNAILCVDGRPTVYFRNVGKKDSSAEAELQRLLWNHGTASLLVVIDPKEVRVYSSLARPERHPVADASEEDARLVETLAYAGFSLRFGEWIHRVETGQLYREHPHKFLAEHSVDNILLTQLRAASNLLCQQNKEGEGLPRRMAHALLARLLFACYLRERKVIRAEYLEKAGVADAGDLLELLNQSARTRVRDALYRLFTRLQGDFNGSLFGGELAQERELVRAGHIETLRRFLNGDDLETGQMAFGFPVYDFSLIPVETISAIYESFLGMENQSQQRASGAFYTPRHLAELTIDVATEGWDSLLDKRCCDPTCGSGIFLVLLFNRMADEWRARNSNADRIEQAKALREILVRNLCGVDSNETACRITCFSLYLAFLDQLEPRDIWGLEELLRSGNENEKVLPDLLALPKGRFKNTPTPAVYHANFFSRDLPLEGDFDIVVGNPPWVGRNQPPDKVIEEWIFSDDNPFLEQAPKGKQVRQSIFLPQRQRAHAFMWKVPLHLKPEGRACLVLPSKVFLGKTDEFQSAWLRRFSVERVLQLADYSFILFKDADCPATIVTFRPQPPCDEINCLDYDVPKVDCLDPRPAVISILPDDRKVIPLAEIMAGAEHGGAATVWKRYLWGTGRDLQLLERLMRLPSLSEIAGEAGHGKRWVKGQGFQPFYQSSYDRDQKRDPKQYGEPEIPQWSDSTLFIRARNKHIDLFLTRHDCAPIGGEYRELHRSRDHRIFRAPLVLINQGFTKFAFSDFTVLFQDSLQSIAGPPEDEDLLLFLCGALNSPLSTYFFFHTASNWGVERDKVHFEELLRLPFPLPGATRNPKRSRDIVRRVARRIRHARERTEENFMVRGTEIAAAKAETYELVAEYYGLSTRERMLVEDTVEVFEPSSTPPSVSARIPTLIESTEGNRAAYCQVLCETLNRWAHRSGVRVSGRSVVSPGLGLGVFTLYKSHQTLTYEETQASDEFERVLRQIRQSLRRTQTRVAYLRGFTYFEGDQVHLLKPLQLRHWTRTAALNDADALVAAFLQEAT